MTETMPAKMLQLRVQPNLRRRVLCCEQTLCTKMTDYEQIWLQLT